MAQKTIEELIIEEFQLPNFVEEEDSALLFGFRPDLALRNQETLKAFVIRRGNNIPEEFIKRFNDLVEIPDIEIKRYIAFASKPDSFLINTCTKTYNTGVCYISGNNLIVEEPSAIANTPLPILPPAYVMPHTEIFFSSVEELSERKKGKYIVERINSNYKKSIYANLVERDRLSKEMTPEALRKEITTAINQDEFFLGILTEEFASAVQWEIQVALSSKPFEKIILLVKDNEDTRKAWSNLLTDIEMRYHIRRNTIWYTKFVDLEDFEELLRKEVMSLISKKYKDNGSTFL